MHQRQPAPLLEAFRPDIPQALARAVARALSKNPSDRWQTAAEMRAALLPFAGAPTAKS
jgi:serine/threonine-protein kinase